MGDDEAESGVEETGDSATATSDSEVPSFEGQLITNADESVDSGDSDESNNV